MNYKDALKHNIFKIISQSAKELDLDCYVIGGFVRDFLLNRGLPKDIDIVAIGNGIKLAKQV
ncbi:MAG: tRNA nucleotidyltransferase, partial [Flavobacteriaceae bacterium]|nr:tRNA nucleotidyltransferase [Flavobacteriaceae bacterium]